MEISTKTILKVLTLTALFIGAIRLAHLAIHPLIWVGTAFFLAVALNPIVSRLARYMPRRSRGLAITIVFLVANALIVFLLISFIPPLVSQLQELANKLPDYTDKLVNGHGFISDQVRKFDLVDHIKQSQSQFANSLTSVGGSFFSIIKDVFSSLAAAITVLVMTIFMLLEGPFWVERFWRVVPEDKVVRYRDLADKMYRAVSGYVTGNLLTSLIAAILVAAVLTIIGVPFAIPLGILVGVIDLIPLVGATIAAIVVVLVSLFADSLTSAIIMTIFFIVYQQLENHLMQPIVYGRTVQISPLTVLIAILLGASIGGILGALVAIPIAASIQILVKDAVHRNLPRKAHHSA